MPSSQKKTEISAAEIEIKRRGRRRLIGAITLGLLAVVILPMVFDHEPKNTNTPATALKQEIEIQIPTKEAHTPLPAPTLPPAEASKPEAATDANVATIAPTINPLVTAPPLPTQPVAKIGTAPLPERSKKADAKSEPIQTPKLPPVLPTKPSPKTEPKPVPEASAKSIGKFVVQIGAYKDTNNANNVIAQLKDAKLQVFSDTLAVKTGNVTRVRLGPYATKEKAEAALVQAKLTGVTGKVVLLQ